MSFEKPVDQDADSIPSKEEGNTDRCAIASINSVLRSLQSPRTLRNNMNENREISSAPSAIHEGRSEKAISRHADVHALEKPDCAVVPVNPPNKAAQAAAEAGEGRAQMEENIEQPHMRPTQSGERVSQGLSGVRREGLNKPDLLSDLA